MAPDRSITERRVDVATQVRLELDRRGRAVHLDRPPLLAIGPERDPAGAGVDIGSPQLRVVGAGQMLLGVDLPHERLRAGLAIRGAPAGTPAVGNLRDGAHESSFVGNRQRSRRGAPTSGLARSCERGADARRRRDLPKQAADRLLESVGGHLAMSLRITRTCAATVCQMARSSLLPGRRAPSSQTAISAGSNLMNQPTLR